jgi:hypothetical protein
MGGNEQESLMPKHKKKGGKKKGGKGGKKKGGMKY